MNINEAKKIVDKLSADSDELWKIPMIPAYKVKALLDTLDQPKPEVQQCVAEWYEENKDKFYLNLHKLAWELIENLDEDCFVPVTALNSDFKRWYFRNKTAMKTLINMHQFGYEVEQEKLYKVKIHGARLFKMKSENQVRFKLVSNLMDLPDNEYDCTDKLTEQEIKQADERLWQFAKVVTE